MSDKRVSAGSINAMGLIDEILHYCCMIYRKKKNPTAFSDALKQLDNKYGKEKIDELLFEFGKEFTPTAVYRGEVTLEKYMSGSAIDIGTGKLRSNREATFEEIAEVSGCDSNLLKS